MKRSLVVLAGLCGLMLTASAAFADEGSRARGRSSAPRQGGYSYSQADTINTYGDARGKYGVADSLRDPTIDRQTSFGPFDQGFFFDSGVGPGQHGNEAPFLH